MMTQNYADWTVRALQHEVDRRRLIYGLPSDYTTEQRRAHFTRILVADDKYCTPTQTSGER